MYDSALIDRIYSAGHISLPCYNCSSSTAYDSIILNGGNSVQLQRNLFSLPL